MTGTREEAQELIELVAMVTGMEQVVMKGNYRSSLIASMCRLAY